MSQSFQSMIALKVQEYIDIAIRRLGFEEIHYEYNFSLNGKCGGKFSYRRNIYGDVYDARLHFNLLMMKQDPEKYLKVVVGHEVAHMVAECIGGNRYKEAGHGPEWKYVMKVFGLEPKRTHDFDVSETSGLVLRKTKRHPVTCGCTTHMITSQRRTKIVNGAKYTCKSCGEYVKLVA